MSFKTGIYHHYKRGIYRALMIVRASERRSQLMVVYDSLIPVEGLYAEEPWCRPLMRIMETPADEDCWMDKVSWPDGVIRQRFTHEDNITNDELRELTRLRNVSKED